MTDRELRRGGGPGSGRHLSGRLWIFVTSALLVGCAGDSGAPPTVRVYPVSGRVLLSDGRPLEGGHVYFVSKDGALTPDGAIGSDGSFTLTTGNSGPGAPAGDFKIRIEPSDPTLIAGGRGRARKARLPFPPKYLDEDSSGLAISLRAEPNQLEPFRLR